MRILKNQIQRMQERIRNKYLNFTDNPFKNFKDS